LTKILFRCAPGHGLVRSGPTGRVPLGPSANHMERTSGIIAAAENPAEMRRRMGAAAPRNGCGGRRLPGQMQWRAYGRRRLPASIGAERTMLIPAVDAHTGEPVMFDVQAESTWSTRRRHNRQWFGVLLRIADKPIHRRRLRRNRECRPGSRIRAGAGAVTLTAEHAPVGLGHATCSAGRRLRRRPAASKPSCRIRSLNIRHQSDGSVDAPHAARAGYEQGRALAGQHPPESGAKTRTITRPSIPTKFQEKLPE